jgi:hypothetical protein
MFSQKEVSMKNYKSLLAGIVAMAMVSGYVSPNGLSRSAMADEKKTEIPQSLSFKMKSLDGEKVSTSESTPGKSWSSSMSRANAVTRNNTPDFEKLYENITKTKGS